MVFLWFSNINPFGGLKRLLKFCNELWIVWESLQNQWRNTYLSIFKTTPKKESHGVSKLGRENFNAFCDYHQTWFKYFWKQLMILIWFWFLQGGESCRMLHNFIFTLIGRVSISNYLSKSVHDKSSVHPVATK